jgi:conjugal transfer ATP-binding protein TraC
MNILDKIKNKIPKKSPVKVEDKKNQEPETTSGEVRQFNTGMVSTKDIIAPSALEVDFNFIRIENKYYRTIFVSSYPRYVDINWLSSLINFDATLGVSMYIFPSDGKEVMDDLRRKITEMQAEMNSDVEKGRIANAATEAKMEDALNLQADLVRGQERFFQFGLYITICANSLIELDKINRNLEANLGALMINTKKASLQMEDGFKTTLPICQDKINVVRNMDTTSLATTFPFVSSDLSDDKGIMYGINEHNGSLVIFDRFSMPNYNSVVFATAGAGKSYLVKLEALRSLMLGTDIIIVDPENEYKELAEAVGGQYIAFGFNEESKINPFDLSLINEEGENALNVKVLNLHKLFKVMLGDMDPMEESILDKAIMGAYQSKGISSEAETQKKEAPLIEDVYKTLLGNEDDKSKVLAVRMEKYIKGSFAGIFNQKTTVNLKNNFVVFGIKNLEEVLRPVAMQIILDYIWTVVKKDLRKRILVVDEAWYMMKYKDSAEFLRGIVKRGRKYYLGVTTITQDVDDFLKTEFGKEIVTNSSIQVLLKQHSAAIEQIGEVFYLSEGEKQLLLTADKGEGIFFAGQNHVAIRIIASEEENNLITSNPEELMKLKKKREEIKSQIKPPMAKEIPITKPEETNKLQEPIIKTQTEQPEIKLPVLNPSPPKEDIPLTEAKDNKIEGLKIEEIKTDEVVIPVRPPIVSLDDKIKELETREKASLDSFKQDKIVQEKVQSEQEKNISDLLKKLEGLPPLPKTPNGNKPLFMNQQPEPKIPQPPQFAKKPIPVFKSPDLNLPSDKNLSPPKADSPLEKDGAKKQPVLSPLKPSVSQGLTSPLEKGNEPKTEPNKQPLAKIELIKKPVDLSTGKVVELNPSDLNLPSDKNLSPPKADSPLEKKSEPIVEEKKDEALSIGLQPVPPVQAPKEEKAKIEVEIVKPTVEPKPDKKNDGKMDYDKLFGNGIV